MAETGSSLTIEAISDGDPVAVFEWLKDGVKIANNVGVTLTISNVTTADSGTYNAIATNAYGWVLSNDIVVTVPSGLPAPPLFTLSPTGQTATAGSTVIFTGAASGTPAPSLQWRKDGLEIPGATNTSLALNFVTVGDAGLYSAVATNLSGYAISTSAMLVVNAPPAFTLQPISQTVTAGATVTFNAAASGYPSPGYQWRKDGIALTGASNGTLTLPSVMTSDAGSFTVVASSAAGSVTSTTAILTVAARAVAPQITTQPVSRIAAKGSTVTFSVTASGLPAPTYQWMKNGVALKNATAPSLILVAIKANDAGAYTVVVSNANGSNTSSPANLQVSKG